MLTEAEKLLAGDAERNVERDRAATGARLALVALWVAPAAVVLGAPDLGIGNKAAALALETLGAAAALFAAWVSVSRYCSAPSAESRALMVALAFWTSYLLLLGMGQGLINVFDDSVAARARAIPSLIGAALFVYAGFASLTMARIRTKAIRSLPAGIVLAVMASALGAGLAAVWPNLGGGEVRLGRSGLALLAGRTNIYLQMEIVTAALFALAGLLFATHAWRTRRNIRAWWLVSSFVIAAWARAGGLARPPASLEHVSRAGVLSAASALALAAWAASELAAIRRRERDVAIQAERSRLARELHDTVAQDLAFIVSESRRLAASVSGQQGLVEIGAAAEQALEAARSKIYRLHDSGATDLGLAIEAQARLWTGRAGLGLRLDIAPEVYCSARVQHEILAIVQEAISNTARHAGASEVAISLRVRGDAHVLRICDDGHGFEPQRLTMGGGFGLSSLRERSHALGSAMRVNSSPGQGTTIELAIP